ncbi:MAG: hypothetical protein K0R63_818 [Rickettsiales bacterium]|jgi:uncharacterized protein (DUF488 family)|nr:hypothetical protein [Rickettsiales bacterium]
MSTFYTIGHSTRSLEEFLALLTSVSVTMVIDVRHIPRSRTNPQYNQDTLPSFLAKHDIGYEHIQELGGLRRKNPESSNTYWHNESFRNYADYAMTEPFCCGLKRLRQIGRKQTCAIMCAEAVWWRCHRRIIADYLITEGKQVFHIMGKGRIEKATLTPCARRIEGRRLVYASEE